MNNSALDFAKENYTGHLRSAIQAIGNGLHAPAHYFMAVFSYRMLAICTLLMEADAQKFAMLLGRAGQARHAFLQKVSQGLNAPGNYLCTSKNIGFTAALVAGDMDTARSIARLSPRTHAADLEYEDDFLFFHFMHRLIDKADETELETILQRWEIVLEGGESGYFDVCKSLLSRNADEFESGFDALIATRQKQLDRYKKMASADQEQLVTEGKIFIEGLAVLRIASALNMPMPQDYPLTPNIARVRLGSGIGTPGDWIKQ